MKSIKLFQNEADYEATEDIQLSYAKDTDKVMVHKKGVVLSNMDIYVGGSMFIGTQVYINDHWEPISESEFDKYGIVYDNNGHITGNARSDTKYFIVAESDGGNGGHYDLISKSGPVDVRFSGSQAEVTIDKVTEPVAVNAYCEYMTE